MESIHGHNVLKLIREQEQAVAKDELLSKLANEFGANALYHTCSASDLNAAALLSMFLEKGKLVEQDNRIQFHGCNCGCH